MPGEDDPGDAEEAAAATDDGGGWVENDDVEPQQARKENQQVPTSAMPTSRIARGGQLGWLTIAQSTRRAGIRVGSAAMPRQRVQRMLDVESERSARDLVRVLGGMKGVAMKVGQMLSLIDLSIVDERHRDSFRRQLAKLHADVDAVDFEVMRPQIEHDLGMAVEDSFAEFDEHAFAAASLGQVYRARLHDGRRVAVKVQYPGIRAAVRADMKNLALFLRMSKTMVPTIATNGFFEELQQQFSRELDYVEEERTQRMVAKRFAGHPLFAVPDTIPQRSGESVLTTEYVEGARLSAVAECGADVRNHVGEIIYRFYVGSVYRDCAFNGDPHPGNVMLLDDGRVAFLDFGMYKTMAPDAVEAEREALRRAARGDAEGLLAHLQNCGIIEPDSTVSAADALSYVMDATWWNVTDESVKADSADVSSAAIAVMFPNSAAFRSMSKENFPPEHIFSRRLDFLTFGTLGTIDAEANWYRIASEWLYGAEPVSVNGALEREWRRGSRPSGV